MWLFGGGGGCFMYIPSIRFELDFCNRILCRVFCFGEILPVVRDFCSLSLVSSVFCFVFLFPIQSLLSHGGLTIDVNNSCSFGYGYYNAELECTEMEQS